MWMIAAVQVWGAVVADMQAADELKREYHYLECLHLLRCACIHLAISLQLDCSHCALNHRECSCTVINTAHARTNYHTNFSSVVPHAHPSIQRQFSYLLLHRSTRCLHHDLLSATRRLSELLHDQSLIQTLTPMPNCERSKNIGIENLILVAHKS